MANSVRLETGRRGLLVVVLLLLLTLLVVDLARDRSVVRSVLSPGSSGTSAESLVRGIRGGLDQPRR